MPIDRIATIDARRAATTLTNEWKRWKLNPSTVPYNGAVVPCLSEDLHQAIEHTCDAMADAGKPVEDEAKAFVLVFDELAIATQKWIQDASMQLPSAPPRGSVEMHNCFKRLEQLLQTARKPLPQPVKHLIDVQMVKPSQVAIIYGWKHDDGTPDTDKVREEYEQPGTHYDPKTWVHPMAKVEQAEVNALWANRSPRAPMFARLDADQRAPRTEIPSLDELLRVQAPVKQIMSLHGLDEETLELEASERGLILNGDRYEPIPQTEKPAKPVKEPAKAAAATK